MLQNRAEVIWAERQSGLSNARTARDQHCIKLVETQESVATDANENENDFKLSEGMKAWRYDPNASEVSSIYKGDTMTPRLPVSFGLECEKTILF
ncbi:MAG: hypothetical protein RJA81_76 [Planctomycetota bacterium]|jgi:putative IMPACT (imprinted ancient) family translation regulator